MKRSGECANFQLDYEIATMQNTEKSLTYSTSINLKNILGDMYDKYNKFVIIFNGLGYWTNTPAPSGTSPNVIGGYNSGGARNVTSVGVYYLGISGLDIINNSSKNGDLSNIGFFPGRFALITANYYSLNLTNTSNGIMFNKPSNPNVNITLPIYNVRTNVETSIAISGTSSTTAILFDMNLSFTIYGISEDD